MNNRPFSQKEGKLDAIFNALTISLLGLIRMAKFVRWEDWQVIDISVLLTNFIPLELHSEKLHIETWIKFGNYLPSFLTPF